MHERAADSPPLKIFPHGGAAQQCILSVRLQSNRANYASCRFRDDEVLDEIRGSIERQIICRQQLVHRLDVGTRRILVRDNELIVRIILIAA